MDIHLTFETSTTSVGWFSIDPGFVEKQSENKGAPPRRRRVGEK